LILGRFEAEHSAHLGRLEERLFITKELITKHGFIGFSLENLTDYETERFINKLNEEITTKTSQMRREKASIKALENEYHQELQQLRSSLSGLEENKRLTRMQMETITNKIATSNSRMHNLDDSIDDLDQVNEAINRADANVAQAQGILDSIDRENGATSLGNTLVSLERQAQKLRDEMATLSLQGDTRARLSLKITDKARKNDSYTKLYFLSIVTLDLPCYKPKQVVF
jgi:DNA repair protein RAD50